VIPPIKAPRFTPRFLKAGVLFMSTFSRGRAKKLTKQKKQNKAKNKTKQKTKQSKKNKTKQKKYKYQTDKNQTPTRWPGYWFS